MARLFISYCSTDQARVEGLAAALAEAGFEVWWDRELIGGQDFAQVIEQRIRDADIVIVVWSRDSIASQWVRAEAQKAGAKLLPIRIEAVEPPAPFNALHTLDAASLKPARLVEHVKARLGQGAPMPPVQRPKTARMAAAGAVLALLAALGLFALHGGIPSTGPSDPVSEPFDVRIENFDVTPKDDPYALFLKTKVERNFVKYLSDKGLKVGHAVAALGPGEGAKRVIGEAVVKTPSGWTVSSDLTSANGAELASASLDAPPSLLNETYRSIPEALLFGMRLDAKLNHAQPAKPLSHSIEAYLAFLGAQHDIRIGREHEALELLDQAIAFDPNFAAAIWSKGDLLVRQGDRESGEALKAQADKIDPDHAHISLLPNTANPIPALFAAAMEAEWTELEPGIAQREIEAKAYGIRVTAWSVDPSILLIEVVQADGANGATAAALREKTGALLIVNGGYFDLDADYPLTP